MRCRESIITVTAVNSKGLCANVCLCRVSLHGVCLETTLEGRQPNVPRLRGGNFDCTGIFLFPTCQTLDVNHWRCSPGLLYAPYPPLPHSALGDTNFYSGIKKSQQLELVCGYKSCTFSVLLVTLTREIEVLKFTFSASSSRMEIDEKKLQETMIQVRTAQARRKQRHFLILPHDTDVVCEWRPHALTAAGSQKRL